MTLLQQFVVQYKLVSIGKIAGRFFISTIDSIIFKSL